ncbi:MAG: hypothetical protein ACI9TY_000915 [Alphaproteobacteria bacterium]
MGRGALGRGSVDYWNSTAGINVTQMIYDGQRTTYDVLKEQEYLVSDNYSLQEAVDLIALIQPKPI